MPTRTRISLALLTGLATLVPAAGAAGKPLNFRNEHARAAYFLHAGRVPENTDARSGRARPRLGAFNAPFGFGSALVGSSPVGNGPSLLAIDPATHTIYVANGNNDNGPDALGDTVSVIDARRCNTLDVSRCTGPWPTITVGNGTLTDLPSGIAIDQQTDTVYVANVGDDTVSVFNGAICNAIVTSGCGQTPAEVPVGLQPVSLADDPANHTVYVANFDGGSGASTTVSMIDSATCNANDLAACPTTQAPPAVNVSAAPDAVDVDQASHSVYVTTIGAVNGWSVFDANTCNATVQSGCGQLGTLPGDPSGPNDAEVDPATNTLYTANYDNTISAFDLRRCNASDLAGCTTDTPGIVTPVPPVGFGDHALWVAVDAPLHTVYVTYQKDDALFVIDTNVCNGGDLAACATLSPPSIHTGADPEGVVLDPQTQTLYSANEVADDVSVIDASRCDAQTTSGCRPRAPEVPINATAVVADPPVATTYATSGENTVWMINTDDCNAFRPSGCSQTPPTTTVGSNPDALAVNPATNTLYVADLGTGTTGAVTVLDDRGCNAHVQTGCTSASTLHVPHGTPVGLAVNPLTDTLYVATITDDGGPDLISVFNGAICNASNRPGCAQTPTDVATGNDGAGASTEAVTVNPATNTIYATSDTLGNPFAGDTVYMIDGATCDATDLRGCNNAPATITVGSDPFFGDANPLGIAVDEATDTVYTANIFNGEGPGAVSVINGATCNSHDTSGCDQTPAIAPAGFGANDIAINPLTNDIYTTNNQDTSITTINGNTCSALNASGCNHARTRAIAGDYPGPISIDPQHGTAYAADASGVSVIPLTP